MSQHAAGDGLVRVVILMPVRDDWTSAEKLIQRIDQAIDPQAFRLHLLLVDDGSVQRWRQISAAPTYAAIESIQVVRLRRNVGHQRAIAIGLVYIESQLACDAVLVMDSDGEDTPEGVRDLLTEFSRSAGAKAVFARRVRRSESLTFRAFYHLYRFLHLLTTGLRVQVGNFSVLPFSYLEALVVSSDIWSHYAAAVFRSRLPFTMVPIPRGKRIDGVSRMNFVSLVLHGLSAVAVFSDTVGVRLLLGSLMGIIAVVAGLVLVAAIRFFTDLAIPGWATYASGVLTIIAIQFITIATSFTFFILSRRTSAEFMPLRDCPAFIADTSEIYSHE